MEGVEKDVVIRRFREQITEGVVYLACTGLKELDALAERIEVPPMPFWSSFEASACSEIGLLWAADPAYLCAAANDKVTFYAVETPQSLQPAVSPNVRERSFPLVRAFLFIRILRCLGILMAVVHNDRLWAFRQDVLDQKFKDFFNFHNNHIRPQIEENWASRLLCHT